MSRSIFSIHDDFHEDPDQAREYMLSCKYDMIGNYPGFRASPSQEWMEYSKGRLEYMIEEEVAGWDDIFDYPIRFQWSHDGHISWVHHDCHRDQIGKLQEKGIEVWAGVLFMTPNAPIEAGTGLYRRKDSHVDRMNHPKYAAEVESYRYSSDDMDEWEMIAWCGNVYNRLVTYKAELFHRNLCGFGTNKFDSRLTELFFYGRWKK